MDKAEVIRLKEGEKIKIDQSVEGWTIHGPATVIVVKEETAAKKATALKNASSMNGRIKFSNPIQSEVRDAIQQMNTFCKTKGEQESPL